MPDTRSDAGVMRNPLRRPKVGAPVDMTVTVGSVELAAPVMCASGTAGHGAELGAYFDLRDAGAVSGRA